MLTDMKCFLNTRSLYEHIENVKTNHNICASDVIFLAETRLVHSDDNKNMKYQDLKSHVEMISYAAVQLGHHMD